ncbi:hypothetical protein LTR78_010077 [Recurvomyces mirabilis]|uniref:NmrA-like domain-containing protein n=1 Tax=Recurvomyces mirabilis TaxID=574656 RepID=A0AAE0TQC1_9PEZI|nr:hypothetical protein LTR78_010077 [Recurvomyces mirabilis]KAK5159817.1 hypothetical protein LTS14_001922 [Recurvomyces mirabilis]
MREVLVIGGTGAQGLPVVKALSQSGRYTARVLTRNLGSKRAREISKLSNVTLIQGSQDNQKDLHKAFKGVWGAWVNTDGFTLGEKNELFYGIRAYEIARHEGVQHYIYAGTDYAVKDADWDANFHWGHNDAKGRVADLILSHKHDGMKVSVLTTGPYMDMLFDERGKIPLIAVEDVGAYSLWMFENPSESTGLQLKVATDAVTFEEIAGVFTKVTGKKAVHEYVPLEQYLLAAEPYPDAPANWAAGPDAPRDESTMTWRENFGPWWRYWGEGFCENRDFALLDRIHPKRIKSLEEWMRLVGYNGQAKPVLKGAEDLRAVQQAIEKASTAHMS